jgi:hypothetical protein
VDVVHTEDESRTRGEVHEVDIHPGVSHAPTDLAQGTWAVGNWQHQDQALASYLNADSIECGARSSSIFHQYVPDPLTLTGKPAQALNIDTGFSQCLAHVSHRAWAVLQQDG